MTYMLHLIIMLFIYVLLGLSLNLLIGYSGLISLAHVAFYGFGAYTTALLVVHDIASPGVSLFVGTVAAGLVSTLIGRLSASLKGDSFIIGTLAIQVLVISLFRNLKEVTGGPYGLSGIARPAIFGDALNSQFSFLLWVSIPVVVVGALLSGLYFTPFARVLKAIRDDEYAAQALGKPLRLLRTQNIMVAGAVAGFAGGVFALYSSYIDPSSFSLDMSIFFLMIVVIGGSGNLKGPVIGATLLLILPEVLRFLPLSDNSAAYVRQMLYGLILILIMRLRPQGLFGNYRFNHE